MENLGFTKQLEQFKQWRGLNGKDRLTVQVADLQPKLL